MSLLLTNIGRLFTASAAGVVDDAEVLIRGRRIVWVGRRGQLPDPPAPSPAAGSGGPAGSGEAGGDPLQVVDLEGGLVTPGLVDAHAHPVYAGDRLQEIADRSQRPPGVPRSGDAGGPAGIPATVAATRAAAPGELARLLRWRLARWLAGGTTTVEAKTGYHLDRAGEIGAVRLLAGGDGDPRLPHVEVTFLAAHDVPPEMAGTPGGPAAAAEAAAGWSAEAAAEGARFADVFCDEGYFTVDQARRVLRAGQRAGLLPRLHADELARTGGALLAAEVGAVSADHLLRASDEDARALAAGRVVATLCPVTAMSLGTTPPARLLADRGVVLALGTDHNPGHSGTTSMSLVVGLAVHLLGLSVPEALAAATVGGARAVAAADRGAVRPGLLADLVAWDADHEGAFAWDLGLRPRQVWREGVRVADPADTAGGAGAGDADGASGPGESGEPGEAPA